MAGSETFAHSADYLEDSDSMTWGSRTQPAPGGGSICAQILASIGISSAGCPGNSLPGVDILRMDAMQALSFALAESLLGGQWIEVYEDENGGVYFQDVLNPGSSSADVRLAIPSADKKNIVDLVVVRGYDAPPVRYAGPTKNVIPAGSGPVNPDNVSSGLFTVDQKALVGGCLGANLGGTATKSYPDPIMTNVWQSGLRNPFYDLKAWESLVTHAVTVKGMDDGDGGKVSYSFNENETTWYYPVGTMPDFQRASKPDHPECSNFQTGGGIVYFTAEFNYTGPTFTDRFGGTWPFVIQPTSLFVIGYPIRDIWVYAAANLAGRVEETWNVAVGGTPQLLSTPDWFFELSGVNSYKIKLYYQPGVHPDYWDIVRSAVGGGGTDANIYSWTGTDYTEPVNLPSFNQTAMGIVGGDSLGYLVSKMWVAMTVRQPSVTVTDAGGDARSYSDQLVVDSTPIIVKNLPVPVAWAGTAGGGSLTPDDLAQSLTDGDPTTKQDFSSTPEAALQDLMQGNVVDVSFPFCADAGDCSTCAATLFRYLNITKGTTTVYSCGPSSEPRLGTMFQGAWVNTITYSYQDSSSYTIEVTTGPAFVNVPSFSANGPWIKQTAKQVNRQGIILWSGGNGSDYRVFVQGMGDYRAINGHKSVWRIGEVVNVTIYNVQQEV